MKQIFDISVQYFRSRGPTKKGEKLIIRTSFVDRMSSRERITKDLAFFFFFFSSDRSSKARERKRRDCSRRRLHWKIRQYYGFVLSKPSWIVDNVMVILEFCFWRLAISAQVLLSSNNSIQICFYIKKNIYICIYIYISLFFIINQKNYFNFYIKNQ